MTVASPISHRTPIKWVLRRGALVSLLVASILVLWITYPLITAEEVVGWDLSPHYYLYQKSLQLLSRGVFHGYETGWFAGFPLFSLYASLPYLVASIPYLATGGLISERLSFNLFIAALPLLTLHSVTVATRSVGGRRAALAAPLIALFFLFALPEYAPLGMGIHGVVRAGLFNTVFGVILVSYLVAAISSQSRRDGIYPVCTTALVLVLLGWSHTLSFIVGVSVLLFAVFLLPHRRSLILSAVIATLILAPWFLLMSRYMPYSSSEGIGNAGYLVDPLFAAFPGFKPSFEETIFSLRYPPFSYRGGAAALLLLTLLGMREMWTKKRYFIPAFFLLFFLFVPRELLIRCFSVPLHYYRFAIYLVPFVIILASVGCAEACRTALSPRSTLRSRFGFGAAMLLTAGSLCGIFFQFSLAQPRYATYQWKGKDIQPYNHSIFPADFPRFGEAEAVVEWFRAHRPTGRIAVEGPEWGQRSFGSPHYLLSRLSIDLGLPVVPGLLTESSITAPYIHSILSAHGAHMPWGRKAAFLRAALRVENADVTASRLSLFGVSRVVSVSKAMNDYLSTGVSGSFREEASFGETKIFSLIDHSSLISSTTFKPFIYLSSFSSRSERVDSFRNFSDRWWTIGELYNFPVLLLDGKFSDMSSRDLNRVGGFIVDLSSGTEALEWGRKLVSDGRVVIFLAPQTIKVAGSLRVRSLVVDQALPASSVPEIREAITKGGGVVAWRNLDASLGDSSTSLHSTEGVLLRYGYDPAWRETAEGSTIYLTTSGTMFLFGDGDLALEYSPPRGVLE